MSHTSVIAHAFSDDTAEGKAMITAGITKTFVRYVKHKYWRVTLLSRNILFNISVYLVCCDQKLRFVFVSYIVQLDS